MGLDNKLKNCPVIKKEKKTLCKIPKLNKLGLDQVSKAQGAGIRGFQSSQSFHLIECVSLGTTSRLLCFLCHLVEREQRAISSSIGTT